MTREIKKYVLKYREQKLRTRSIYRELRNMKKFEDLSDLALFNSIICTLYDSGLKYSRREVYSAFRMVDQDDYRGVNETELLFALLQTAQTASAFSHRQGQKIPK